MLKIHPIWSPSEASFTVRIWPQISTSTHQRYLQVDSRLYPYPNTMEGLNVKSLVKNVTKNNVKTPRVVFTKLHFLRKLQMGPIS